MTDIPPQPSHVSSPRRRPRPEKVDTLMRTMRPPTPSSPRRCAMKPCWTGELSRGIPPGYWEEYFADLPLYQLNLPAVSNAP